MTTHLGYGYGPNTNFTYIGAFPTRQELYTAAKKRGVYPHMIDHARTVDGSPTSRSASLRCSV